MSGSIFCVEKRVIVCLTDPDVRSCFCRRADPSIGACSTATLTPLHQTLASAWPSRRDCTSLDQSRILKLTTKFVFGSEHRQVLLKSQNLHDGEVGPHRHPSTSCFKRPKCHGRHSSALRNLLGRQFSAQACEFKPLAELDEQQVGGG